MNDLIESPQNRINNAIADSLSLEIWDHILNYIDTGILDYKWEGYNCNQYPRIEKRVMAQLDGWCRLVGLKPHFEFGGGIKELDETESGNEYSNWKHSWILSLSKQALPGDRIKEKIISEHGKPPGYYLVYLFK